MNQPSVAVIGGAFSRDVAAMFSRRGFRITENMGAANAIVFTGGSDIGTHLYGENPTNWTHDHPERDEAEVYLFKKYMDKPKIGICRGAQLGNVLSGGKLYQHVNNHGGAHMVYDTKTKKTFWGTSMHHQQMILGLGGIILATAGKATLKVTEKTETRLEPVADPEKWTDLEAVYYPNTKFLGIQGHPEVANTAERDFFFGLIQKHLKLSGIPQHYKPAKESAQVFAAAKADLVQIYNERSGKQKGDPDDPLGDLPVFSKDVGGSD